MINISKLYCGLASQSDHLRYEGKELKPIVVYNCTAKCNLRCLHCYSSSTQQCGAYELSTDESMAFLKSIADYKCPVALFSGGEPLLRRDIFELMETSAKLGLRTVISTNGTLIDADMAARIADIGISYIGISLDGPMKAHDKMRAKKGAFDAALKGIANCLKAGVKAGLRFTITQSNCKYISEMFDVAKENGIRRICFYHLVRTGRAQQLDKLALSQQQTRDALDTILACTKEFVADNLVDEVLTVGNHADGPYLLVQMLKEKNSLFLQAQKLLLANGGNRSGEKIASAGWDGSVYADQFWRNYSLGNVRASSFGQIWDNSNEPVLMMLRNKSQFADSRCKGCNWFALCKGNFRFLGSDPSLENWHLEPPCYLTDDEIVIGEC